MYTQQEDFKTVIKTDELNALADGNLNQAIKQAEDFALSYVRRIYDVKEMMKQTGDERDMFLVLCIVHICIYNLSLKTDMNAIPEQREQAYLRSIENLQGISKDKFDLNIPKLVEAGGDEGLVRYEDNLVDLKHL